MLILKINITFKSGRAMYVCLCKGVSTRTIRRCAEEGARTVEEIGRRCGAGTVCGSCKPDIAGLLADVTRAERGREDSLAAK